MLPPRFSDFQFFLPAITPRALLPMFTPRTPIFSILSMPTSILFARYHAPTTSFFSPAFIEILLAEVEYNTITERIIVEETRRTDAHGMFLRRAAAAAKRDILRVPPPDDGEKSAAAEVRR